ncbi:tRNA pseudouridine(55) synthase TruB [Pelagibacterales bacterium]|jgi:tRNA pseudouridine55 synthase|nr:tRNA pseudouridine(55) synthase TruB [Pelagibacterales bacterium]|tara:strand:- start:21254 stop:22141 length:888 start_codon:yes stop_codon:yes gene_type:complete
MTENKMDGWLFIDKPIGISSFSVIRKIRRILNIKKIGHAGTLDPFATGALGIAIGEATKSIDYISSIKEYEFNITFGESKTTEDLEGETLERTNKIPNENDIKNILDKFTGIIDQHPPKHSSIKINGQRSYKLARKDINFKTKSRKVTIYEINHIKQLNNYTHKLRVKCSSGTYIRSLGRDIALRLNSLGYISFLRRTKISKIDEKGIISLDKFLELVHIGNHFKMVLPIESVLDDIPAVYLKKENAIKFRNGQVISLFDKFSDVNTLLVYKEKKVLGLGKIESGTLVPIRMFNI